MENFKLDIYKSETGDFFPEIEPLNNKHKDEIINEIKNLVGLSLETENLFVGLAEKLSKKDFDEKFTYDIHSIFKKFDLSVKETTLIIWNRNEIDEINTKILLDKWEYIWYGDSDDAIILYQKKYGKLLLISHYGRVFYRTPTL